VIMSDEYGDPYVNWNEENDHAMEREFDDTEVINQGVHKMETELDYEELEALKNKVVELLVSEHDMLIEEAESAVEESSSEKKSLWHENAEASDLAKLLASDDDDE
jgi:hypothetical protein